MQYGPVAYLQAVAMDVQINSEEGIRVEKRIGTVYDAVAGEIPTQFSSLARANANQVASLMLDSFLPSLLSPEHEIQPLLQP